MNNLFTNLIKGFVLILLVGITHSLNAQYTVTNSWVDNNVGYWYLSHNDCGGQTYVQCGQPSNALPPVGHSYTYSGGTFYPSNSYYQTGIGSPISCCNVNFTVSTQDASCGQSNGKLNIDPDVNGGTALPFQVYYYYGGQQYYGGGGFNDYSNNYVVNLPPGNYTNVTVIDAYGCEKTRSGPFTIGGGNNPNASASNNGPLTCNNPNIQLNASGGGSYSWSGPNGFSSNQQSPTVNTVGTYTVTVTNNQGCTDQATTAVTSNIITVNPITTGGTLTCTQTSVQLGLSGAGTNNASYSWTGPSGFSSSQKTPTVNNAGTYNVTVTKNGCTGQASATVTSDITNVNPSASNNGPFTCTQSSVQLNVSGTGTNNASYSWSGPSGFSSNQQAPTVNNPGTYTVTVTKDGCTGQASTTVTEDITNVNPSASNNGPITCDQTSVQLTLSGAGTNNASYSWTGPSGFTSSMQNPTVSNPGTYNVTVTKDGCTGQASTTVTGDTNVPTADASVDGNSVLECGSGSITLSGSSNQNNVSYSWTGPGGFTSTIQNPTVNNPGTYTLTVTNNTTGCDATDQVTITSTAPDAGTSTPTVPNVCIENNSATISATPDGNQSIPDGYSLIYVLTQGQGLVIVDAGAQPSFTVDQAGDYTIHSLVYDPNTLDLDIVNFGTTTGFDVNSLLVQGGGNICASLDVAGAPVTVENCEYDLALIKILAPGQASLVELGGTVDFIVKVTNQGDVNSGTFTIMDRLQPGTSFVSAGMGGVHNNGVITWNLGDLEPGEFVELPVTISVDVIGTGKYNNWAEITSDSGDDVDSTPDENTGVGFTLPNDLVDNHNDMMLDDAANDEDDNDFEEIFVDRGLRVAPMARLQGAMTTTGDMMMRDDLNQGNLIPNYEPYSNSDYFQHVGYGGGETVADEVLNIEGDNGVVDWVLLEIRDKNNPAQVLETAAALILRDGHIVGTDGVSDVNFPSLQDDYYHVAIRHRNHLGAMTQNPIYLSSDYETTVDFTSMSNTYGLNAQHQMPDGSYALWSGATNGQIIFQGNGSSTSDIFFEVLTAPGNNNSDITYIYEGYSPNDRNMDCLLIYQGVNNEVSSMFFNVLTHPNNINNLTNYIINENIPGN